ncbi:RAB7A [Branchiostoma lanceolatum]|uniref:RAB7A protein n=1 Tax=Branchiostoma lanceolatum TaxID=7740 RepID=A0A8K0A1Q8_BRALA|nr:RAB7A [Branchiostoma lanceolatum]
MGAYESTGYAVYTSLEHAPNTNRDSRHVPNKCGICHKVLTLSKSLRCSDNFCERCLEAYADGKAAIVCPTCGEAAVLPPGGVVNLPDNLWILPTNSESAFAAGNPNGDPVGSDDQVFTVCSDHFSGRDAFFCKNCDRVVCKECVASGQCQHGPTPISDTIKRKRYELQKAFVKWREQAKESTSELLQDLDENVGKRVAVRLQAGKEAVEKIFKENDVKESEPKSQNQQQKKPSNDVRILLLGDRGSGKTYVMGKYTGLADGDPDSTLSIDFCRKEVEVDGRKINLQLWDTSGDARFRSVISRYFRQADAVVLVYDASHPESFEKVKWWRDDFLTITAAGNAADVLLDAHSNVNEGTGKENTSPFDEIIDDLKTTAEKTSKKVSSVLDDFVDVVKTSVSDVDKDKSHPNINAAGKDDTKKVPKILDDLKTTAEKTSNKVSSALDEFVDFVKTSVDKEESHSNNNATGKEDTKRDSDVTDITETTATNDRAGPGGMMETEAHAGVLEAQERTDVPFVVIGNIKFENQEEKHDVQNDEAQAWCDSKGIPYLETDCQDRSVLDFAFQTLIRNVVQNRQAENNDTE